MSDTQNIIVEAFERRAEITPRNVETLVRDAVLDTIERLDRSYLEASLDLGASQWTTFWKVTVPLTMPGIVSGIILVFIPMLGMFLVPDLLGGTNAIMIGNVITDQFKAANDWPFGAALSFLLMYITFAALAVRAFISARSRGGVGV